MGESRPLAYLMGCHFTMRCLLHPRRLRKPASAFCRRPSAGFLVWSQPYHGLLTSLIACAESLLAIFQSNGEAGDGYADLAFTSGAGSRRTGVVIEIKRCDKVEDLYDAAEAALAQIREKHYAAHLDRLRCSTQRVYGIAFSGRLCLIIGETLAEKPA